MSRATQAKRQGMARALGTALRVHQARLEISQEEFAYREGLNRTLASLLERGLRTPTITVFCTIADALEVAPDRLMVDTLTNLRA